MGAPVDPATVRAVRYELRDNQAADLAEQLLTLHPPATWHRFVCYPISGRSVFADLESLLAASSQVGADVVIAAPLGDTLTLQNVMLTNLYANDFSFV